MAAILIDGIGRLISSRPIGVLHRSNSSRQSAFKQTDREILVIRVQCVFSGSLEIAQQWLSEARSYQIFSAAVIRKGTAANVALDSRRENGEADKTRQLTQESSLITGGFSGGSLRCGRDQSFNLTMKWNLTMWNDSQICSKKRENVKESAKRIFRCQYFCRDHLGV